jgi:hypothetical protein
MSGEEGELQTVNPGRLVGVAEIKHLRKGAVEIVHDHDDHMA